MIQDFRAEVRIDAMDPKNLMPEDEDKENGEIDQKSDIEMMN